MYLLGGMCSGIVATFNIDKVVITISLLIKAFMYVNYNHAKKKYLYFYFCHSTLVTIQLQHHVAVLNKKETLLFSFWKKCAT